MDFLLIVEILGRIISRSVSFVETWDRITISGNDPNFLANDFDKLSRLIEDDIIELKIDGDPITYEEYLEQNKGFNSSLSWVLYLYKPNLLDPFFQEKIQSFIFFQEKVFIEWLRSFSLLTPFEELTSDTPKRIILTSLKEKIIGPKLLLCPITDTEVPTNWPYKVSFPSDSDVKKVVHFVSDKAVTVNIDSVYIDTYTLETEITSILRLKSAELLSCTLVQEFYSDKVVLKSTKRIECAFSPPKDFSVTKRELQVISELVTWAYSERSSSRIALLVDRLSLEVVDGNTLIEVIIKYGEQALLQAKEQDRFLLLEQKDIYMKELRGLLLEVRKLSDDYTSKIRLIQSGLLRDTLAAIFLVSVSLFSKFPTDPGLFSQTTVIIAITKGLGVYFILSLSIQLIISITDAKQSFDELLDWVKFSNNYISTSEREKNVICPLKKRRSVFRIILCVLAAIYVVFALLSWNFYWLLQYFNLIHN